MARPTLFSHRKFLRLARALKSKALAVGHLELIWHAANESGNPVLGDAEDVEALADWQGEDGVLAGALVAAGFVDVRQDGLYEIHDYWHHAPSYVRNRRAREEERRAEKLCESCGLPYYSADPKSRYCSGTCRSRGWRQARANEDATQVQRTAALQERGETLPERDATLCNSTPNTPHPTPITTPDRESLDQRGVARAQTEERPAPTGAGPPAREVPKAIPEDWQPDAERRKWLVEAGLTKQEQADVIGEFVRWARASGYRRTVRGWQLAFLRNPHVKGAVGRAKTRGAQMAEGDEQTHRRRVLDLAKMFGIEQGADDWQRFEARVLAANEARLRRIGRA